MNTYTVYECMSMHYTYAGVCTLLIRPGRMSAGSSFSGKFVVMMTIRFGVSTTPSRTFSRPAWREQDRSPSSLSCFTAQCQTTTETMLGGPVKRRLPRTNVWAQDNTSKTKGVPLCRHDANNGSYQARLMTRASERPTFTNHNNHPSSRAPCPCHRVRP